MAEACCSHDEGELALCRSLWAIRDGKAVLVPAGMPIDEAVKRYIR